MTLSKPYLSATMSAIGQKRPSTLMSTLIYKAPMLYYSQRDEDAFFEWLQAIPGVISVRGLGRELHIRMRSKRVSAEALRELLALYKRYKGDMSELEQFENSSNTAWFRDPKSYWYKRVFAGEQ